MTTTTLTALQKRKLEVFERLGYTPSPEQMAVHMDEHRIRLAAGGEQGGKSLCGDKETSGRFWEDGEGGLFWLVGEEYADTEPEFGFLVDDFANLGILVHASKNINPGEIIVTGNIRIETKSAKDERKLGKVAPKGIILCEAAQASVTTYHRLRGRIAPKRGWLLMTGTFEGSLGWYPELWNKWQVENPEGGKSFSIPSWSNKVLYPGGRDDPEILLLEASTPPDIFQERYGAVPCPPSGRVFNEFQMSLHVKDMRDAEYPWPTDVVWCESAHKSITYDPRAPVYLWTDPGYAGACSVLAAHILGDTVYVFDEIYERSLVTEQIIQIAQSRPWWSRVEKGVADIAAKQHQAMPAVAETWQKKVGLRLSMNRVGINEGNERLKTFLIPHPITGRPKIYIDPACQGLISEFGGAPNPFSGQTEVYRWKVDRNGTIVGKTPEDTNNHSIKALIYGLVDKFGYATRSNRTRGGYNYLTGRSYG